MRSQHVRVCFLELNNGFYLELIAALDDEAKIASFLKVGFYHLCFLVEDLYTARERLRAHHCFPLPEFESEAFSGKLCQFFLSPHNHLIELAEMSSQKFNSFFKDNLTDDD